MKRPYAESSQANSIKGTYIYKRAEIKTSTQHLKYNSNLNQIRYYKYTKTPYGVLGLLGVLGVLGI